MMATLKFSMSEEGAARPSTAVTVGPEVIPSDTADAPSGIEPLFG